MLCNLLKITSRKHKNSLKKYGLVNDAVEQGWKIRTRCIDLKISKSVIFKKFQTLRGSSRKSRKLRSSNNISSIFPTLSEAIIWHKMRHWIVQQYRFDGIYFWKSLLSDFFFCFKMCFTANSTFIRQIKAHAPHCVLCLRTFSLS